MAFDDLPPQRAELPNGVELHYVMQGVGTPLVFIHGAMGDWRSWEPQWDCFRAHYRCVSYSRRYSFPNRNTMSSPHHSALDEAQDLALFLDHLGWDAAVLVGSSYGGYTALALAVAQPARVRALVATEPPLMRHALRSAAGRQAHAEFRARTITPANAAFRAGDDELAARIMTGGINGATSATASPASMERRLQNIRAMKMLALSTDEFPELPAEALASLSMPLFLLSGCNTPPVHAAIFENLCADLPQARTLRVPGAGHGVGRDAPEVFNNAVLQFLRDTVSSPVA